MDAHEHFRHHPHHEAQTAMTPFYRLWKKGNEPVRDRLLDLLPREDLASLRLVSSACCSVTTKRLFKRIHVTFTANTFTKGSRVQALARIGHQIEHLAFSFPHSAATFLPPLIHPATGAEICFLYTPHTSMASVLSRPKYANTELGEILTQQYPPLFHAATNVPSFINALRHLPNLRHLTIRTPGQDPRERYRRDAVDYALISLRIAIERAPLTRLNHLSLDHVHPSALHYLRHSPAGSFGALPSSPRRWGQIRRLSLAVESWDFSDPASPGRDHLQVIDHYLSGLAPSLEKLSFTWLGLRGPCPLALADDPLFAQPQPRTGRKLFNEVTSPMSPLPPAPGRRPLHFPRLRRMTVRNAVMHTPQLAALVDAHRPTVREFDFEDVVLADGGDWDDALAPLKKDTTSSGKELWSKYGYTLSRSRSDASSSSSSSGGSSGGSSANNSRTRLHTVPSHDDLPSTPSAAVAAASRELLSESFELGDLQEFVDFELTGMVVGDEDDVLPDGHGEYGLEDELASEIAAPQEVDRAFTAKLKKKKRRRRRKRDTEEHDGDGEEKGSSGHSRGYSQLQKQPSSTGSVLRGWRRSGHDESTAAVAETRPSTPPPNSDITAPIMDGSPPPVLLQPTVYDPNGHEAGGSEPDGFLSSVQRNIEQEEAQRILAEDAEARTSALRRAKEAVLLKLSEQFVIKKQQQQQQQHHRVYPLAKGVPGPDSCALGARLRDGMFGKSFVSVLTDERAMSSQSALVPLMFTRT